MGLECAQEGGGFVLSASWTLPPGAKAYWRWLRGGSVVQYGRLSPASGATHTVDEAGEYSVKVQAFYTNRKRSAWATASATCSAMAAPASVSASCRSDGALRVSWGHQGPLVPLGLQFDVEVDGTVVGSVNYRSVPGSAESYAYSWDEAHSNKAHRVRVRVAPSPAGVQLGEDRESAWTAPVTASKCTVFKPTGFTTASCNSHGVVHLEWDPVNGADRYDLKNAAPGEESVNYEGPGTEVYAQRWEGETYKIRIRARARTGQVWSGWTAPVTVICDPFAPASPVWPQWLSPNGAGLVVTEPDPDNPGKTIQRVRHWTNPALSRFMPDSTKNRALGRDNCSVAQRNSDDTGWTRTCTIYWAERVTVRADLAWHPADQPHIHVSSHVHRHDDDTGDYGHGVAHHHCTPELVRAIINGPRPLPGLTGCPTGAPHGDHVDFDDGRTWADRLGQYALTGAVGGIAVAASPLTGGLSIFVGAVGSGATGEVIYQLTKDGKVVLTMEPARGCAPTAGWQKRTPGVKAEVTSGGYATEYNHIIHYCENTGSN